MAKLIPRVKKESFAAKHTNSLRLSNQVLLAWNLKKIDRLISSPNVNEGDSFQL